MKRRRDIKRRTHLGHLGLCCTVMCSVVHYVQERAVSGCCVCVVQYSCTQCLVTTRIVTLTITRRCHHQYYRCGGEQCISSTAVRGTRCLSV